MSVKFTLKEYGTQFKNDLWCKEAVTGYTYSYTWMANQLGHFALGYVPALLIISVVHAIFCASYWFAFIALFPSVLMFFKELSDVNNEKKLFKISKGAIPLDIKNVWLNALTATWFTFVGSVIASTTYLSILAGANFVWLPIVSLVIMGIPSLFIGLYWISKKICFQRSNLPFMYRLSYFPHNKVDNIDKILSFLNGETNKITIVGPPRSGKTDLAVAIGTELAATKQKVRYGDIFEFLEDKGLDERINIHVARLLWSWEESDVWIIDDCDINITTTRRLVVVKVDSTLERIKIL